MHRIEAEELQKRKPEDWRALMQLRAEINLYGVYSAPVVLPQL